MQKVWLNNNNNKNLIVFFSGWGQDEKPLKHLSCKGYDVLVLFDYRDYEIELPDFSKYEKKYLIAWSMGVFVCNYFYDKFKDFDEFIAINGTQRPIDDKFGIPKAVYQLTVDNFNELSCRKFMSKISTNEMFQQYAPRTTEELREELISIQNLAVDKLLNFDRAYSSRNDRIIPSKNQIAWWDNRDTDLMTGNTPHYIFDLYESFSDIVEFCMPG